MFGKLWARLVQGRWSLRGPRPLGSAGSAPPISPTYPSSSLRGLRTKKWIKPNGAIGADAFMPDEKTAKKRREKGWTPPGNETSINWEDSAEAVSLSLRDGENAKYGAARLPTKFLELAPELPEAPGIIGWERREEDDNPFHGNLLFDENVEKHRVKCVAAYLALCSTKIDEN